MESDKEVSSVDGFSTDYCYILLIKYLRTNRHNWNKKHITNRDSSTMFVTSYYFIRVHESNRYICIQKERTYYMSPNRIKEHTYITLYKKSYDFITFICMVSIWSLHVIIKYIRTKRHNNNTQTVALCNKASIWHLLIKPIAKNKKKKKKSWWSK